MQIIFKEKNRILNLFEPDPSNAEITPMKRFIVLLPALICMLVLQAHPRVYVRSFRDRPVCVNVHPVSSRAVVVRPACPGPKYVWTSGNWVWSPRANQYMYVEGRWMVPQPHAVWIDGHWKNTRYGWHWVPGHWKNV
jgi:hypothetical protein